MCSVSTLICHFLFGVFQLLGMPCCGIMWFACVRSRTVSWQGARCFFGRSEEVGVLGCGVNFVCIIRHFASF